LARVELLTAAPAVVGGALLAGIGFQSLEAVFAGVGVLVFALAARSR
jgi:hypothetical protein